MKKTKIRIIVKVSIYGCHQILEITYGKNAYGARDSARSEAISIFTNPAAGK